MPKQKESLAQKHVTDEKSENIELNKLKAAASQSGTIQHMYLRLLV